MRTLPIFRILLEASLAIVTYAGLKIIVVFDNRNMKLVAVDKPIKILVVGQVNSHRSRLIEIHRAGKGNVCDALGPTPSELGDVPATLYNGRPTLCGLKKTCSYYSTVFEKWLPYGKIDRSRVGAASVDLGSNR